MEGKNQSIVKKGLKNVAKVHSSLKTDLKDNKNNHVIAVDYYKL